jgi:hypothetical protein
MTATSLQITTQHSQIRPTAKVVGIATIAILAVGLAIGLARPATHSATIAGAVVPGAVLPDRGVTVGPFAAEYKTISPDRGVVVGDTFDGSLPTPVGPDRGVVIGTFGAESSRTTPNPFAGYPAGSIQNASAATLDRLTKGFRGSAGSQGGGTRQHQQ